MYNPELQKKSLERRYERQQDFDDFVTQLKEHSRSDKHSTESPNPLSLHRYTCSVFFFFSLGAIWATCRGRKRGTGEKRKERKRKEAHAHVTRE